jgi:hypothetical protein
VGAPQCEVEKIVVPVGPHSRQYCKARY